MPELPEVETIKRQLVESIVGEKLDGKKIAKVRRRGKLLLLDFEDGTSILIHLKMTGQLILNGAATPHTRHIFKFGSNKHLIFNDVRKFGWWKKVKDAKKIEKELGPEPLQMDFKEFKSLLEKHPKTRIKTLLINQKFIAGIGNIYSDEILHAAKIYPLRRVSTLSDGGVERIFGKIKDVLKAAIKHRGSSTRNFLDVFGKKGNFVKYHKVYQREGGKCVKCSTIIKRIKMGGRSAHFCPQCQK